MSEDILISIPLEDGRTVIAKPDSLRLLRIRAAGEQISLSAADGDMDTSGHGESTDVFVDVEGHAMALRLPTTADAAALRRALAIGAVSATLVAAGAIGGVLASQPSAQTAPDKPAIVVQADPAPAPDFNRHGSRPE